MWGTPVDNSANGKKIRGQLIDLCISLKEDPISYSEPDVIIELGEQELIFIEVKHRSGNDNKDAGYTGWSRYESKGQLSWRFEEVKNSGCYELARNWCLLKNLAGQRQATLVCLGPAKLFDGKSGARLNRFADALGPAERSHFMKITWPEFLTRGLSDVPEWFVRFCSDRGLIG